MKKIHICNNNHDKVATECKKKRAIFSINDAGYSQKNNKHCFLFQTTDQSQFQMGH